MKTLLLTALKLALTKTKLVRYGAGILASVLISWGAVKAGDKEAATLSLSTLGTLVVSALIEKKKEDDAKVVQRNEGLKDDGWIGPVSQEKIIGRKVEAARRAANPKVGLFLVLAIPFFFTGCWGSMFHSGPTLYAATKGKDGTTRMQKVLALDADAEGDEIELKHGLTSITVKVTDHTHATEQLILSPDRKTVLGIAKIPKMARIATSAVVDSKGEAFRKGTVAVGQAAAIPAATASGISTVNTAVGLIPVK